MEREQRIKYYRQIAKCPLLTKVEADIQGIGKGRTIFELHDHWKNTAETIERLAQTVSK